VLRARSRDIIKKFGYTQPALDSAEGVLLKTDYLAYITTNDHQQIAGKDCEQKSAHIASGIASRRVTSRRSKTLALTPPAGCLRQCPIYLDMAGQLLGLKACRHNANLRPSAQATPDWSIAFREAGLDMAQFTPAASSTVPLHAYDTRLAWEGSDPAHPGLQTHIEAASFRGKITYFETVYPWTSACDRSSYPTLVVTAC